MSTSLPEFSKMDATGIGDMDKGADNRSEGVLDNKRAASIVATGKRDASVRKGMSISERSKGSR